MSLVSIRRDMSTLQWEMAPSFRISQLNRVISVLRSIYWQSIKAIIAFFDVKSQLLINIAIEYHILTIRTSASVTFRKTLKSGTPLNPKTSCGIYKIF